MQGETCQLAGASPVRSWANADAILVSMPFFSALTPSIQIGLLAAIGKEHSLRVDTLHLTLDFAARVGLDVYEELCDHNGFEIGHWLFSLAAFGDNAPDLADRFPYDFPQALGRLRQLNVDEPALCGIRRKLVPEFLADAEALVDWSQYGVVGFTSTFQQNTPALALARRLKTRFPNIVTLFGGGNLSGEMGRELIHNCPWIDYAIDGEADRAFPEFLLAMRNRNSPSCVPGVFSQDGMDAGTAKPILEMNELPLPDYDEYFRRAEELGILSKGERTMIAIPFETSRGCWWGQKHHCTFCGLNREFMKFREKTTDRVLDELASLTERYGIFRFGAVDNIMPRSFLNELVPALISEERNYDLFFEIKANLTRADLRLLSEAGIRTIQPGIESFSSHVLQLMRKGVRGIQNVNLLRWGRYYGVQIRWNILWGFPGEQEADYKQQEKLVRNLLHLDPPATRGRLGLYRFSPFHFDRAKFKMQRFEPEKSLSYVYPPGMRLDNVAYFFEHEFESELPEHVFEPLIEAVDDWKESWECGDKPWLVYRWSPGLLQIEDGRDQTRPYLYSFASPLAEVYVEMSDRPITAQAIRERLDLPLTAEEIADALDVLVSKGLMMREDDLFLALAIPAKWDEG